MHINELDAPPTATVGRPHTADGLYRIISRPSRRLSARSSTTSSSAAATSDRDSFSTALDAFARPQSESGLRGASLDDSRTRMGSTTTITAAAAAQAASGGGNWPGGIMRETDIQVESRELAGLDAELRRRTKYLPREDRRLQGHEYEALRDLSNFLRDVTPPPGNYMSMRTPSSPSIRSSISSLRRRKPSRKVGTLKRFVGVLMRKSNGKTKNVSNRHSNSSLNSVTRPPSVRKKKWHSRIRLPDTAVAGTTVEGHRHIAISIPIEYAHIGPEPRYKFPKSDKRKRPRPTTTESAPRIYNDINVRPLSALIAEPHIGTQLGPVAEERESISSKTPSWEGLNYGSGSGIGGLHHPAEVRKVRLASRNTFGTVHEEFASESGPNSANNSRPATRSGSSPIRTPLTPPRRSSSGEYNRPRTPASSGRSSSDEIVRKSAHRMGALAALTLSNSRPSSSSAHSLRSFASASPGGTTGRIHYPKRNSSLQPNALPETPNENNSGGKVGRGRGRIAQGQVLQYAQGYQHSRDSSRDQYTLQESIFSEPSYLESSHTIDSGDAAPGPIVSRSSTRDGTSSKRGDDGEAAGSGRTSRDSADGKRWSLGGNAEDGTKRVNKKSPLAGKVLTASRSAGSLRRPSRERLDPRDAAHASGQNLQSKMMNSKPPNVTSQAAAGGDGSTPSRNLSPGRVQNVALMESPNIVIGHADDFDDQGKEKEGSFNRQASPQSTRKLRSAGSRQSMQDKSPTIPSPKERRERRKTVLLSRKQRIAELRKALEKPETQPADLLWERRMSSSSEESYGATPGVSPPSSPWRDGRPSLPLPKEQRRRPTTLPAYLSFTPVLTVADLRPESPAGSSAGGSNQSLSQRASVVLNQKDSVSLSLSSPTTVATIVKTSPVPPYQTLGSVTPPQSPPASAGSPSTPSPSSEVYQQHEDQRSSINATPLKPQPPLKRLSSVRRRASLVGRSSPVGSRPPSPFREGIMGQHTSPSRPKTAGKGGIVRSRHKDYFSGASYFGQGQQSQSQSQQQSKSQQAASSSPVSSPTTTTSSGGNEAGGQANDGGGASGAGPVKSTLKMTRSELFERYEGLRDRQSRDLERRLRRLEKHGDYWLTSMLPLLTDLSQTLGQLALGNSDRQNQQQQPQQQQTQLYSSNRKGKGRAVTMSALNVADEDDDDDEVRGTIYADGRKSRFGIRSTPAVHMAGLEPFASEQPSTASFEPSEGVFRRSHGGGGFARPKTAGSGRVFLRQGSEGSHHPGLGYRVRVEDHNEAGIEDADERDHRHHRHGTSSMHTTPNRYYGRTSTRSTPQGPRPQPKQHQHLQQQHPPSGSTTMVDNTSIKNNNKADAHANSLGTMPTTTGSFRTMRHSSTSLHDEYKKHETNNKGGNGGKTLYALHANAPLSTGRLLLSEQVAAEHERLARIEALNEQIDTQMRSLPTSRSHTTDGSTSRGGSGGGGGGGGGGSSELSGMGGLVAPPRIPTAPPHPPSSQSKFHPHARNVKCSEESLETYQGSTTTEEQFHHSEGEEEEQQQQEEESEIEDFDLDVFPAVQRGHGHTHYRRRESISSSHASQRRPSTSGGVISSPPRYRHRHRSSGTGMEVVTPLMRELQLNGSRPSLESVGSEAGDSEVRALKRGPEPRSVVGFGAFSR